MNIQQSIEEIAKGHQKLADLFPPIPKATVNHRKHVHCSLLTNSYHVKVMENVCEVRQCYKNSFNFASHFMANTEYVVGMYYSAKIPVPIEHAWVRMDDDEHFDPTLQNAGLYDHHGLYFPYWAGSIEDVLRIMEEEDTRYVPDMLALRRYFGKKFPNM